MAMKKSSIESEINQGLRFNDNFTQIPRINRKNKICGNKLYYYEKDYVRGYNLLKRRNLKQSGISHVGLTSRYSLSSGV